MLTRSKTKLAAAIALKKDNLAGESLIDDTSEANKHIKLAENWKCKSSRVKSMNHLKTDEKEEEVTTVSSSSSECSMPYLPNIEINLKLDSLKKTSRRNDNMKQSNMKLRNSCNIKNLEMADTKRGMEEGENSFFNPAVDNSNIRNTSKDSPLRILRSMNVKTSPSVPFTSANFAEANKPSPTYRKIEIIDMDDWDSSNDTVVWVPPEKRANLEDFPKSEVLDSANIQGEPVVILQRLTQDEIQRWNKHSSTSDMICGTINEEKICMMTLENSSDFEDGRNKKIQKNVCEGSRAIIDIMEHQEIITKKNVPDEVEFVNDNKLHVIEKQEECFKNIPVSWSPHPMSTSECSYEIPSEEHYEPEHHEVFPRRFSNSAKYIVEKYISSLNDNPLESCVDSIYNKNKNCPTTLGGMQTDENNLDDVVSTERDRLYVKDDQFGISTNLDSGLEIVRPAQLSDISLEEENSRNAVFLDTAKESHSCISLGDDEFSKGLDVSTLNKSLISSATLPHDKKKTVSNLKSSEHEEAKGNMNLESTYLCDAHETHQIKMTNLVGKRKLKTSRNMSCNGTSRSNHDSESVTSVSMGSVEFSNSQNKTSVGLSKVTKDEPPNVITPIADLPNDVLNMIAKKKSEVIIGNSEHLKSKGMRLHKRDIERSSKRIKRKKMSLSNEDYIPLAVPGPTKFSVTALCKPLDTKNEHPAFNFKEKSVNVPRIPYSGIQEYKMKVKSRKIGRVK